MKKSISRIALPVTIIAALSLSACQPKPMKIEQCWSPEIKKQASELAKQMMLDAIYDDWGPGK